MDGTLDRIKKTIDSLGKRTPWVFVGKSWGVDGKKPLKTNGFLNQQKVVVWERCFKTRGRWLTQSADTRKPFCHSKLAKQLEIDV